MSDSDGAADDAACAVTRAGSLSLSEEFDCGCGCRNRACKAEACVSMREDASLATVGYSNSKCLRDRAEFGFESVDDIESRDGDRARSDRRFRSHRACPPARSGPPRFPLRGRPSRLGDCHRPGWVRRTARAEPGSHRYSEGAALWRSETAGPSRRVSWNGGRRGGRRRARRAADLKTRHPIRLTREGVRRKADPARRCTAP